MYQIVVSRSHDHPNVDIVAAQNAFSERVAISSAIKLDMLTVGEVCVFPSLVFSSEWGTAARQALLEAADGQLDWHTGEAWAYGKSQRRNPRTLVMPVPHSREEFQLKD